MDQCTAITGRALWMCLLLMTILGKSSANLADETTTLLGLKQAWGNPTELSTWSEQTRNNTCSSWVGVTCDPATSTVIQVLSLSGGWLNGSIPDTLGRLASLRTLSLTDSNLDEEIPDTLGNLTSLRVLDLGNNYLTGPIPETLGNLSSLQVLDLSYNYLINGSIPDGLGNIAGLRVLSLYANFLRGSIPASFGNLTSIQYLYLSGNILTSIPVKFENLASLRELDLSHNALEGPIPETLGSLGASLLRLWLGSNYLVGALPPQLGQLSNLVEIDVSGNTLTGLIPEQLGNLSMLQGLSLRQNSLTGHIPAQLIGSRIDLSNNALEGPIPATLGNLGASLLELYVSSNELDGPIPPAIGNLTILRHLNLGNNTLVGEIPKMLGNLGASLLDLDLSLNKLEGPIPQQLGNLSMLQTLYLYDNELSGSIPRKIENLMALQSLWLNDNFLSGDIPQIFTALPNLVSLRLANNNLSGPIPTQFSSPAALQQLELNGNFLTGVVADSLVKLQPPLNTLQVHNNCLTGTFPKILKNALLSGTVSFEDNCFNGTVCNAKCGPKVEGKENKSANNTPITGGVVGGFMLLVVGLGVVFIVRKRKRKSLSVSRTYRVPGSVQHYTLVEVIEATENYTKKIGEGAFSTVYKADFRDGSVAAVKHFNKKKPEENFWQEVEFLAHLNHRYLVNLIGYCDDQGELMLMYDFMDRGSLSDTLYSSSSNPPLTWNERATILLNIARGIEYLHFGAPIPLIHRDIKSANILLSSSNGKSLQAKLADFGLGKHTILESYEVLPVLVSGELQQTPLDTRIAGTLGYMDPEYLTASHLSPKSDVFSYGVVILELVTGKKAVFLHEEERTYLFEWAKPYLEGNQIVTIVDPKLGNESIPEVQLVSIAGLVRRCIDNDSRNRPTIRGVLTTLLDIFHGESETRALFSTGPSKDMALRSMKVLIPKAPFEIFGSRDSYTNNCYTQSEILPRD